MKRKKQCRCGKCNAIPLVIFFFKNPRGNTVARCERCSIVDFPDNHPIEVMKQEEYK